MFPLTRVNGIDGRRAFANGQFMLFRREAYDAIGGHEAVKEALLRGSRARAAQSTPAIDASGVFFADGLFHCRMYADWPQFRRGWKRIFSEAASRKAKRLSQWSLRIRWLGTIFPAVDARGGPARRADHRARRRARMDDRRALPRCVGGMAGSRSRDSRSWRTRHCGRRPCTSSAPG